MYENKYILLTKFIFGMIFEKIEGLDFNENRVDELLRNHIRGRQPRRMASSENFSLKTFWNRRESYIG